MTTHSPRDLFGFRFVMLARRWRRAVDRELQASGLSDATWAPLVHLSEGGDGISQTELASRVDLDASSLVRLLDLLVDRGLVERRVDPKDRRAREIVLTTLGQAEVARIRSKLFVIESGLLEDLPDHQIEIMLDGFKRISTAAEDLLSRDVIR